MNKRKLYITIISTFIFLIMVFLSCIFVSADDEKRISQNAAEACNDVSYFSFETTKFNFCADESINVSYVLNSKSEYITDIDYYSNGFQVNKISIDNSKKVNIELISLENVDECVLSITMTLSNSSVYHAKLYGVKERNEVFISPASLDNAKAKSTVGVKSEFQDLKEVYTIEEWNLLQSNNNDMQPSSYAAASLSSISPGEVIVSGELSWNNNNIINFPLRNLRVDIFASCGDISIYLGSVISDDDGKYELRCTAPILNQNTSVSLQVKVYADDLKDGITNVVVKDENGNVYFATGEKNVIWNKASVSTYEVNVSINMLTDAGKALQISQAIITARDYAREMMGAIPESITVYYPYTSTTLTVPSYNKEHQSIYVCEAAASTEGLFVYSSWDLLMHEYGHHIQYQLGIIDSPGGGHSSYANNADTRGNKDDGIRLAWAESWPTVFALMAQKYYASLLTNIDSVGDSWYTAYNGPNYDIETTDVDLGEACEQSIMAVLWDIFDNDNDNDNHSDTISLGHAAFWAVTTGSQAKTFSEFVDYFYEQYPEYVSDIGKILTYYNMATSIPILDSTVTPSQITPPKFTWTAQGGSINYPNNSFELIVYDKWGKEILRSGILTTTSYTLTSAQWQKVLYSYGTTYKVAVSAIQTGNPVAPIALLPICSETGPYISEVATFSKPAAIPLSYTMTISNNATAKLREITESLQPCQYVDYKVTFDTTSRRIVQTFGESDTYIYIYDSTGAQVAFNHDSGYGKNALINYYFQKDQQYTIRVRLYPSDEAGSFKLSITPATTMKNSSSASLSSYEDIYSITNSNSESLSVSLYPHNTTILTFTPAVTGNYTFTINSSIDTYIYVIDPRSHEAVKVNVDYNDDSGEGQNPLLTKELEAGVPYYIIVSTYNPSTMTSPTTVTFVYNKEN